MSLLFPLRKAVQWHKKRGRAMTPRVPEPRACILWTGARDIRGYGVIHRHGRPILAHRVAWEKTNGPLAPGRCLINRCGNRACVNPAHWLEVDRQTRNWRANEARAARYRKADDAAVTAAMRRISRHPKRSPARGRAMRREAERLGITRRAVYYRIAQL